MKKGTYREEPLQGKRHSPSPLVVSFVVTISGGGDNDPTNRPAHLQSSCAGTSEDERDNLAGVGGAVRNEESPRDAFQGLSDHKNGK